ncbi:hypothetical protein KKA00_01415, partial [bacterium]|nr:hypothetical protein [bacterium]
IAIASIFVFTSWTGAELFMVGKLGAPFLKIPPAAVMVVIVIPIMIYTYFGGFRAVVLTDFIQFILMAGFIVVLGIVSYNAASGVITGNIIETLSGMETPYYGPGTMFGIFACGIAMPIILLVAYLPGWMIEQDLLLRIQGAKSLKEAKKGAWMMLLLISVFVIGIPTLIAFHALILFPPGVEGSAAVIGGDATGIISAIILGYFPVWGQVLMFIGLIAAQMSTVDTFANVIALPLTYDLAQPILWKKDSKESIAKKSRFMAVIAILFGLIYALNANSLMDVYILSSGVLTASIAIPTFSLFWKRVNGLGITLAAIFGFLGNVLFYIWEYRIVENSYQPAWLANTWLGYIIVGIVASIVGLVVGSLIGKPATAEQLNTVSPTALEGTEIFDISRSE